MKNFIQYLICILAIMAVVLIPDVNEFVFNSPEHVMMAAGPGFAALKWKTGQNNMGGYKDHILFIPSDAVSACPLVSDDPKSNDDLISATGAFEFIEAGGQPIYVYCTRNTVKYDASAQGEDDGISFNQVGEFFFPGNTKEMHAFNALVKNTPGYLVLEDSDGKQILVGQPGLYASIKPSFTGGQARADRRGTKYEFAADSNLSAAFLDTPINFLEVAGVVVGQG